MKLVSRLAVRCYVFLVVILCVFAILFALNKIPYEIIGNTAYTAYNDVQLRMNVGSAAVIILLLNFVLMRSILGNKSREKTIAFDNPAGRVSVSLTALEDMTRRIVLRVPEVKEVRSAIKAGRNKVLEIDARVVLKGDVNIPEMTSSVQELIKKKVEDTIGIEKSPIVRVHVSKIFPKEIKIKKQKETIKKGEEEADANIPFQGYRA